MQQQRKSLGLLISGTFYCILLMVLPVEATEPSNPCPIPRGWQTQLDPESLEPILKGAFETPSGVIPQQALNQYLSIMTSQWDAKLMETYLTLLSGLNAQQKKKILTEQTKWLEKREKESTKAGKSEEGGSLGPTAYSETFIRMTKARAAELLKRLSEGGISNGPR